MSKYTVKIGLVDFDGVERKVGEVIELSDEQAVGLSAKIEKVEDKDEDDDTNSLPQTKMSQYKVKEAFELEGVNQEVDSQVELSDEKAAELGEKVEKVEAGE